MSDAAQQDRRLDGVAGVSETGGFGFDIKSFRAIIDTLSAKAGFAAVQHFDTKTAMDITDAVTQNRDAIARIVAAHGAANPRIFGSVLHGTAGPGSDLDLLVDPIPGRTTLLALARMQIELGALLHVAVDLQTPGSLSPSFRQRVLAEARPL